MAMWAIIFCARSPAYRSRTIARLTIWPAPALDGTRRSAAICSKAGKIVSTENGPTMPSPARRTSMAG